MARDQSTGLNRSPCCHLHTGIGPWALHHPMHKDQALCCPSQPYVLELGPGAPHHPHTLGSGPRALCYATWGSRALHCPCLVAWARIMPCTTLQGWPDIQCHGSCPHVLMGSPAGRMTQHLRGQTLTPPALKHKPVRYLPDSTREVLL